jgi:hypothetical protein
VWDSLLPLCGSGSGGSTGGGGGGGSSDSLAPSRVIVHSHDFNRELTWGGVCQCVTAGLTCRSGVRHVPVWRMALVALPPLPDACLTLPRRVPHTLQGGVVSVRPL